MSVCHQQSRCQWRASGPGIPLSEPPVYTALAQKAMSKYFRKLLDAIMGQIQATRKAMGEKDPVAPGTTKGETPRLKITDQALR
ncbi:hypothetical protein HN51_022843 [Arachis hypogaea]|uniref:Uncharacterized protein n=1 Tax=Arachis hypogaea TaxID=3818 RepID=A0A445EB16_ARAHY|nr:hypothetical protein Ahy_A02g006654 [Arachis hypogaea]